LAGETEVILEYILENPIFVMSFITMRLITFGDLGQTEIHVHANGRKGNTKQDIWNSGEVREIIKYEECFMNINKRRKRSDISAMR
jgi:hypothetical protein